MKLHNTSLSYFFIALAIVLLPTGLLWAQVAVTDKGMPLITNYLPREYKAGLANWAILQDKRGLMYVGNDNGILEYDGQKWRLIRTNGTTVRALATDAEGRIYAGGAGTFGYLEADSTGLLQYVSLNHLVRKEDIAYTEIWTIRVSEGGIIFQTDDNLLIYRNGQVKTIKADTYFSFGYEANGSYYVQQNEYGLMRLTGDQLITVKGSEQFASSLISQVLAWNDKELLLCVQGLGLYKSSEGRIKPFATEADDILRDFRVYNAIWLKPDQNGKRQLALGMLGIGVVILNEQGQIMQIYNKRNGLADDFVLSFFEDNQHGLWTGMYNGISRIEYNTPLQLFNEQFHQLRGVVNVVSKHKGEVYVGTVSGLFRLAPRELTHAAARQRFYDAEFEPVKGVKVDCWDMLAVDDDLLIGTFSGVKLLRNNEIKNISQEGTPPNIFSLWRSAKERSRVFVGSAFSVRSMIRRNGEWVDEGRIGDIREDVRYLREDKNGNLWIATASNGIYRASFLEKGSYAYNPEPEVKHYHTSQGLPSGADNHLFLLQGEIRVATSKGFYRLTSTGDTFEPDPDLMAALGNAPRRIMYPSPDPSGKIWFYSRYGNVSEIGCLIPDDKKQYTYQIGQLSRLDDLHAVRSLYAEGRAIWFSDINGVYRYDPTNQTERNYVFSALIRRVSTTGDSVLFRGTYFDEKRQPSLSQPSLLQPDLPYKANSIRFEFSATAFNHEKATRFQFRLFPYDTEWSDWIEQSLKEYTNLPEGDYTFRVRAKDIYGNIGTEAAYAFSVKPPWYRAPWAYVAYILLSIVLMWLVGEWRIRSVNRDNRRLSAKVQERTRELQVVNKNLHDLNDELSATLDRVKEQNQVIQDKSDELSEMNQQLFDLNGALSRTVAQVQLQNKEIEQQRDEISRQKENIESSIRYARRIQDAILPDEDKLKGVFDDYFIYYQPRDIVSGDFYWYTHRNGKDIIAAVDCTGHSVPGAFMSMMGASLLSHVVNENHITRADLILNEMHRGIREALQQDTGHNRDGMDMALCVIDRPGNTIEFAGAKNPLYLFQEGMFTEVKGDRQPIGGLQKELERNFTLHTFSITAPTTLYMFSDGYQDQFGGADNQKFKIAHFRKLIQDIHQEPMPAQKLTLSQTMQTWMGSEAQVDDMLIVGIRLHPFSGNVGAPA